jgi:hypothetical protein
MSSGMTLEETIELLHIYNKYVASIELFYKNKKSKFRLPNFPEDISENIVKHLINIYEGVSCKREKTKGDLITTDSNEQIEVKCFTSDGPSSFGPNECWSMLYFLDAKGFFNGKFKLYKVNLSNTSNEFKGIPMNKTQTYEDQCRQKRRPRIAFKSLHKYVSEHVSVVFEGNVFDLVQQSDVEKGMQKLSI